MRIAPCLRERPQTVQARTGKNEKIIMKKVSEEELAVILAKHQKWLNNEEGGERADLSDAELPRYLEGVNLAEANLSFANLAEANLSFANLAGANLYHANLQHADLHEASLEEANLVGADLSRAGLGMADLAEADLRHANLSRASLWHADLRFAQLDWADFTEAVLDNADAVGVDFKASCLKGATFGSADLRDAEFDESEKIRQGICLKDPMVGYLKADNGVIVTLEIPSHAMVFSIDNNSCRTNMARVVDISDGLSQAQKTFRIDDVFLFPKGEMIYPKEFTGVYNARNGEGIYFFRSRKEAEEYTPSTFFKR